jgi:hypothetical protein
MKESAWADGSPPSFHSPGGGGLADKVKGLGCRPVVTYLRALRVGVRKPPRKGPAGAGRQLAVYGDLTMQRLAWWMRWPA